MLSNRFIFSDTAPYFPTEIPVTKKWIAELKAYKNKTEIWGQFIDYKLSLAFTNKKKKIKYSSNLNLISDGEGGIISPPYFYWSRAIANFS